MDAVKTLDEKYEIVREIKRGGFGVVYYGRDRLFGKPVAIKAISPDLLGEAKYVDLFQAESLSVARLNHHNIVRLYDIKHTDDGQFYIIMEFIDGVDLGKLINAHRKGVVTLPFHLGAYIMAQCCAGLDYAHARRDPDTHQPLNIVHQDISPANIMVNRQGEIKIIDFGLAGARRRSHAQRGRKREVLLQGKIAYTAPEQLNGAKSLDRRSDIFAAGLVLYEILTGERFFQHDDPAQLIAVLEAGNWNFDLLGEKAAPVALQQIVHRAVQSHPENRYQTANQMYLDLMTYLSIQESGPDLANELGRLVDSVAPSAKLEVAAPKDETPTESLRKLYSHSTSENGVHQPPAPSVETEVDAIVIETVEEKTVEGDFAYKAPAEPRDQDRLTDSAIVATPEVVETWNERSEPPNNGSATEAPIQDVPFYQVIEEAEEDDDEVRTIIDVIRISTRSHKKLILATLGGVLGAFLLFSILDTMMQWTSYGAGIYNKLFPPAIRIVSFPPNAQISLDDKLLPQTTPLAINKISPGVHKLILSLPRFDPIVRSIQVPARGQAVVEGEAAPKENQPYVFRFKTTLELSSKPTGAEVYLNGIKYTQPTPCRVVWEVGTPLQIEMDRPGFARLTGFTFNTLEGVESIEDRRLWRFQRIEQNREHYSVEGVFAKAIVVTSTPPNAEIYLDGSDRPVGVTGFTNRLLLTLGTHTISLRKKDFLPKTFTIQLDEKSPEQYSETLSRVVKILARDASGGREIDLGATVLQMVYENKTTRLKATTPCEFTLLPYKYTLQLRKDGYRDLALTIPPTGSVVIARMERIQVGVEVLVVDEATGEPLQDVEIRCRSLVADGREINIGDTDDTGVSTRALPPGEYRLTARKAGYGEMSKNFTISPKGKNRVIFKMAAQQ